MYNYQDQILIFWYNLTYDLFTEIDTVESEITFFFFILELQALKKAQWTFNMYICRYRLVQKQKQIWFSSVLFLSLQIIIHSLTKIDFMKKSMQIICRDKPLAYLASTKIVYP